MKESEMQEIIDKFVKWNETDFSQEEMALLEYYEKRRELSGPLVNFSAGYLLAKSEAKEASK